MSNTTVPAVDVRRSADRFHTRLDWLDSRHSFSFGPHHDPTNTGHGLLVVHNDDVVRPGSGFGTHPHRDMEIVTWVLSGELEHQDSEGNTGVIHPGLAQRMSAGRGIAHSEKNHSTTADVHLVQMWVVPDTAGIDPGYEQRDISAELTGGGLVPIASGRPDHHEHGPAVRIHQREATLWGGRLGTGESVTVPDDRHVHLFVARGASSLEGAGDLDTGDAVRLTAAGDRRVTAGADGAELLIWATA